MIPLKTRGNSVIVSKKAIQKNGGVVLLALDEYRQLCEQAVPTYHLTGKAATDLDKLVEEGMREYERGECIVASSMTEALKIYERRSKKH